MDKSTVCLDPGELSLTPDLLVIPYKRWLVRAVTDTNAWPIYHNKLYLMWEWR